MNTVDKTFSASLKPKVVLIDGLIFQFYRGAPNGISRVWLNLIPLIQRTLTDHSVVILKRGQYSSGIPGCLEYPLEEYDFADPTGGDADTARLDAVVDELKPICFLSSYYSRTHRCPNLLLIHDMIPEVMKEDLTKPAWVAKQKAISAGAAFITVSESTRRDLLKYYSAVAADRVKTAYNGITPGFRPAPTDQVSRFLSAKGIMGDYILLVGGRGQYKGSTRFLEAFSRSGYAAKYRIIAVGGEPWLTPEEEFLRKKINITYTGWITDQDLNLLYCGAFALVYPSRYEGFGLPVAEAMACGCPAIIPRHSSLPEVAGDAGIYADAGDVEALKDAIVRLEDPQERAALIDRGIQQARRFNWADMADVFVEQIRRLAT